MKRTTIIIIILLASLSFQAISQQISGTVYEINNKNEKNPLPGVNIYWIGTTLGCVTDIKGIFRISSVGITDKKLIFSFIGYHKDTIDVTGKRNIEVQMKPENKQLGEVVIRDNTGGSYISKLNPIKAQMITTKELARAACCNLSESFETNASVDVNFADAITGARQIQLLGLSGVYSQVISENIPLIRGLGTSFGLNYIPGPWMESIQVAKGTSSVTNGYESITGQINVEYKKPATSEAFYLNLYGNEDGRKEANANARYIINDKLSTMVFLHVDDQQKKIDRNHDQFMDVPQITTYNIFNRWDYINPGKYTSRFGIKYMNEDRVSGMMNFNKKTFNQEDTTGISTLTKTYGIDLNTKRMESFWKNGIIFGGKNYSSLAVILSGIYHHQEGFLGLSHYDGLEKSFNANLLFTSNLVNERNKVSAGLNYQYDSYKEDYIRTNFTYLYQVSPPIFFSLDTLTKLIVTNRVDYNFDRTERTPGAFFEYTYNIPEKFSLIAGIRADHHSKYGSIVTPRLHLRYIFPYEITLRGSVGKGYHVTNLMSENFSVMASQRLINIEPGLQMEEAWNYGLNLTKDFLIAKRKAQIDLEYYHTDFIHQVITDMDSLP
ncbi:MAG: TonB-dependent receptor, partial [Bacteroidetes bacterium]|nr:TonB-dependent receptor [Bacteroidota bacterium]